jgi:hypothetical protein
LRYRKPFGSSAVRRCRLALVAGLYLGLEFKILRRLQRIHHEVTQVGAGDSLPHLPIMAAMSWPIGRR